MSEERDRGATSSGVERMGSFAAVLWIVGITAVYIGVAILLVRGSGIESHIATGFVQLGVYLGGVLLLRRAYMRDKPLRQLIALRRPPVLMCVFAVLIGASSNVWIELLFEFFIERFPLPPGFDQAGMEGAQSPTLLVLRMVQLALVIPFTEEMLFRGGLLRPLLVKRTWMEPLVITSLLFCMVHYMRWQFAVPILPLALCLGGLRLSSGSLFPSVLLHASFNGAAVASLLIPNLNRYITWPVFIGSIALSLACAAGAFLIGRTNVIAVRNRALDA